MLADYPNDLALLQYVIAGFNLSDVQAAACGPIPQPVMTRMLKEGAMGMLIEDYFAGHPAAAARRHGNVGAGCGPARNFSSDPPTSTMPYSALQANMVR